MLPFLEPMEWRGYGREDFPAESWTVEGDLLHALPRPDGVLYHVSEEAEAPWQSGPEMQLLDDANHPDGRVPETSCGALYGVYAPQAAPLCQPGLFNVARISVRGSHVEHWLNGVHVLSCFAR